MCTCVLRTLSARPLQICPGPTASRRGFQAPRSGAGSWVVSGHAPSPAASKSSSSKVGIRQCDSQVTPLAHISFRAGGGRVARQTRANLRAPLRPFGGRSQAFLRVPSLPPRLGWGVAGAAHGWGGRGPCVARSVPHGCGTHRLWGGCPLPWFATALLLRVDLRPWTGRLAPWACPEQPDLADFGVR